MLSAGVGAIVRSFTLWVDDQVSQVGTGAQGQASGETEVLGSHIQRPWCGQGGLGKARGSGRLGLIKTQCLPGPELETIGAG